MIACRIGKILLPLLLLAACGSDGGPVTVDERVPGMAESGAEFDGEPVTVDEVAGVTFERVPGTAESGAVFDTGPADSWRDQVVGMPTALYDEGMYKMWYCGSRVVAAGESVYLENGSIGLAVSDDGYVWRDANDGQPVFTPGAPGTFDGHSVFHPFVLRVGATYYLWYGGADGTQGFNSVRVERIGLATSSDGIHWNRANGGAAVLDIGGAGAPDSIQATGMHVIHDGRRFRMWYGAYDGLHTLMYAESADGRHWIKGNGGRPVTGLDPGGKGVLGPSIYSDGVRLVMLYSRLVGQQWMMYGATSDDGTRWTPAWNGQPVLAPSADPDTFDAAGPGRNSAVHPAQIIVHDGVVRVWYMGEAAIAPNRQSIGLMEGVLIRD